VRLHGRRHRRSARPASRLTPPPPSRSLQPSPAAFSRSPLPHRPTLTPTTHPHPPPPAPPLQSAASDRPREILKPSNTLFVVNFDRDSTEREIERAFDRYGRIVRCQIKKTYAFVQVSREAPGRPDLSAWPGRQLRAPLGTNTAPAAALATSRPCSGGPWRALVAEHSPPSAGAPPQFETEKDASDALKAMDGAKFHGRTLKVEYGLNDEAKRFAAGLNIGANSPRRWAARAPLPLLAEPLLGALRRARMCQPAGRRHPGGGCQGGRAAWAPLQLRPACADGCGPAAAARRSRSPRRSRSRSPYRGRKSRSASRGRSPYRSPVRSASPRRWVGGPAGAGDPLHNAAAACLCWRRSDRAAGAATEQQSARHCAGGRVSPLGGARPAADGGLPPPAGSAAPAQ
jgi:RNA recognition motif-containing protein